MKDAGRNAAARLQLATPAAVDIFTQVLTRSPITRAEICERTGLSPAAVTKALAPLTETGFVENGDRLNVGGSAGRPVLPVKLTADALFAVGLKVDLDVVAGVVTTLAAEVIHAVEVPLSDRHPGTVTDAVVMAVELLIGKLGSASDRVAGVCVTVSGDADPLTGLVRDSPRLGWTDVDLGALVGSRLGMPVYIDNDVRALTIAENWFGVGLDADTFAIVTIGAGIGCGLFINGDVVSGAFGVAGEIGHLPLGPREVICECGRHGCVEAVASSNAIRDAVREARDEPELTFDDAVELAHGGYPAAVAAFDRAADVIGAAITTVINIAGPDRLLVAGEGTAAFDLYETHIRQVVAEYAFGSAVRCAIAVRTNTLQDWARGAAVSLIHAIVRSN